MQYPTPPHWPLALGGIAAIVAIAYWLGTGLSHGFPSGQTALAVAAVGLLAALQVVRTIRHMQVLSQYVAVTGPLFEQLSDWGMAVGADGKVVFMTHTAARYGFDQIGRASCRERV